MTDRFVCRGFEGWCYQSPFGYSVHITIAGFEFYAQARTPAGAKAKARRAIDAVRKALGAK